MSIDRIPNGAILPLGAFEKIAFYSFFTQPHQFWLYEPPFATFHWNLIRLTCHFECQNKNWSVIFSLITLWQLTTLIYAVHYSFTCFGFDRNQNESHSYLITTVAQDCFYSINSMLQCSNTPMLLLFISSRLFSYYPRFAHVFFLLSLISKRLALM